MAVTFVVWAHGIADELREYDCFVGRQYGAQHKCSGLNVNASGPSFLTLVGFLGLHPQVPFVVLL